MAENIVGNRDEYVEAKEKITDWLYAKIGDKNLEDFECVDAYLFAIDGVDGFAKSIPEPESDPRPMLAAIYEREIGGEMHPASRLGNVLDIVYSLGLDVGFESGYSCAREAAEGDYEIYLSNHKNASTSEEIIKGFFEWWRSPG